MKLFLSLLILFSVGYAHADVGRSCRITSQSDVSVGSSAQALAVNGNRRCLTVCNKGSGTVYLKVDAVHSGTEGIAIATNTCWEPNVVPINSIWLKASTGTITTAVLEGK